MDFTMFQFIRTFLDQKRFNTKARDAFTSYYRFAQDSKTFREYCKKMHGIDCFMQNNVSKSQFKAICKFLKPKQSVLDIGCGNGRLLESISDQSIKLSAYL